MNGQPTFGTAGSASPRSIMTGCSGSVHSAEGGEYRMVRPARRWLEWLGGEPWIMFGWKMATSWQPKSNSQSQTGQACAHERRVLIRRTGGASSWTTAPARRTGSRPWAGQAEAVWGCVGMYGRKSAHDEHIIRTCEIIP